MQLEGGIRGIWLRYRGKAHLRICCLTAAARRMHLLLIQRQGGSCGILRRLPRRDGVR